jgi:uncharacterized protein (DUF934 family)
MLIKDCQIAEDHWTLVAAEGTDGALPDGDIIVPLALWLARRDELAGRNAKVGVQLEPQDPPQEIAADLDKLAVVALHFPASKDGRLFSTARLLRERFGYKGELRAVGQFGRDQMFYLQRCGVDAFEMGEDRNIDDCLKALGDFTVTYQAAADQPLPLYRRR